MKVFVLEDDENRIKTFKKTWVRYADFTFAESYDEAINLFDINQTYDVIMLDHDLGHQIYMDSSEYETGYHFSEWLVKNYNKDVPIVIHSHNNVGAENMSSKLKTKFKNVNYIPFGNLITEWDRGTLNFLGHYKYS